MDVQLDSLIEKLKKEGVEEGQEKAAQMIRDAEKKSASILEETGRKAEQIIDDAQKKAAQFQSNSELALKQAARDTELLLKSRITALFDRVFKQEISETMTPEFLKDLIGKFLDRWGADAGAEIVLKEADLKKLEAALHGGVRKALKETLTLRPGSEISGGFRIRLQGEDVYYDFTDEAIADALKLFLKPRLKEILDGQDG
ncbi:MAG TPA: hypothetical protein ENN17_08845 [bacterium]|nr:hypothetical protein [bacterium]